jgi:hypothetical protein
VILFLLFTDDVTICMELDPGIHIGNTWFVLKTGCDKVEMKPRLKSIVVAPIRGNSQRPRPAGARAPMASRLSFLASAHAPLAGRGGMGTAAHGWEAYRFKRQRKEAARQRLASHRVSVFRRLDLDPPLQNLLDPSSLSEPLAAVSSV